MRAPRPHTRTALALVVVISAAAYGCAGNVIESGGLVPAAGGASGSGPATSNSSSHATTATGSGSGSTTASAATTSGAATSGSSTASSTATSAASSGGPTCDQLAKAYEDTLAKASECNVCGKADGCATGVTYTDTCDCNVVLDSTNLPGLSDAKLAYWSWKSAGCAPILCKCPGSSPGGSFCKPASPGSCAGSCTP
jgi:hypothetical protein